MTNTDYLTLTPEQYEKALKLLGRLHHCIGGSRGEVSIDDAFDTLCDLGTFMHIRYTDIMAESEKD